MEKTRHVTFRSTSGFGHQSDTFQECSQRSPPLPNRCLPLYPKRRRGLFQAGSNSVGELSHASSSEIPIQNLFDGTYPLEVYEGEQVPSQNTIEEVGCTAAALPSDVGATLQEGTRNHDLRSNLLTKEDHQPMQNFRSST